MYFEKFINTLTEPTYKQVRRVSLCFVTKSYGRFTVSFAGKTEWFQMFRINYDKFVCLFFYFVFKKQCIKTQIFNYFGGNVHPIQSWKSLIFVIFFQNSYVCGRIKFNFTKRKVNRQKYFLLFWWHSYNIFRIVWFWQSSSAVLHSLWLWW